MARADVGGPEGGPGFQIEGGEPSGGAHDKNPALIERRPEHGAALVETGPVDPGPRIDPLPECAAGGEIETMDHVIGRDLVDPVEPRVFELFGPVGKNAAGRLVIGQHHFAIGNDRTAPAPHDRIPGTDGLRFAPGVFAPAVGDRLVGDPDKPRLGGVADQRRGRIGHGSVTA